MFSKSQKPTKKKNSFTPTISVGNFALNWAQKVTLLSVVAVTVIAGNLYVHFSHAATIQGMSPGGTYTDWYFPANPSGYDSLQWTFMPIKDPAASLTAAGLLHYYAYNFGVINSTSAVGSGYAGLQTNGIFNGQQQGKVINYSIWGSNGASGPDLINPANTESGGWQVMTHYEWIVGHNYNFELKAGDTPTDAMGKWWALWVTDTSTGILTFVGQQRVATTIGGLVSDRLSAHTSMFAEDLHWWRLYNDNKVFACSDFENSAMLAKNLTMNGTLSPQSYTYYDNGGQIFTTPNGFVAQNCPTYIALGPNFAVQHSIGYWPNGAPAYGSDGTTVFISPTPVPTPIATPKPTAMPVPIIAATPKPTTTPSASPTPSPSPTPQPTNTLSCTRLGDANCDNLINSLDMHAVLSNYGKRTTLRSAGDLTGDGIVNIFDLSLVLQNWGK